MYFIVEMRERYPDNDEHATVSQVGVETEEECADLASVFPDLIYFEADLMAVEDQYPYEYDIDRNVYVINTDGIMVDGTFVPNYVLKGREGT